MGNGIAGRIVPSVTTVGTSATAIPSTSAQGRRSIVVHNNGSATVFLGSSSVTTSNGLPLAAGEKTSFDLEEGVVLYGIVAAATQEVRALEGC